MTLTSASQINIGIQMPLQLLAFLICYRAPPALADYHKDQQTYT
jgi:hypothetical protein